MSATSHRQKLVYDKATGTTKWVDAMPEPATHGIVKWGYASMAMGCNSPSEVAQEQALLASRGVRTEYNSDLEPIFTDARHRREHCRALGFRDRNGGYSDP